MKSISANLNVMIRACEKAAKILIRDFGELEKLQVSKKGPSDFVTNSDLKVEKIIIDELEKARPNYSFITEENGRIKNKASLYSEVPNKSSKNEELSLKKNTTITIIKKYIFNTLLYVSSASFSL